MPAEADSLATQCRAALLDLVRDLAPEVPGNQIYNRPTAEFSPSRDLTPGTGGAVLICETPGGTVTTRELLRFRDITFPVTIILACPQNRILKGVQDSDRPIDPDWRSRWRESVIALTAVPLAGVPECRRVSLDNATSLDGTQYESANLWWTAVNVRCLCRVTK